MERDLRRRVRCRRLRGSQALRLTAAPRAGPGAAGPGPPFAPPVSEPSKGSSQAKNRNVAFPV